MNRTTYAMIVPAVIVVFMQTVISCKRPVATLFSELPASQTHIDFSNDISEDENYNILTYEYLYNGGGVAVGDVNNDGLPDIFFTANMKPDKLYLNKGNFQFEDVTGQAAVAGRVKWKTGAVMADVNGDGLLDIYVCYSGPGSDEDRSNELYINNGIKNGMPSFTESAKQYGLDAKGTFTTTVSFFDMDNDGDLDLFMVNHGEMFYNPFFNTEKLRSTRNPRYGNRLYRNDGGHFTDISEQAHINGSGLNFGLSVSVSDLNNDNWPDLYVTNDYDERDFMYLNNHDGTFREVLLQATGHISEFAMGSDIADYNNDGRPDIMVLDMLPEDNHRQKLLRGASIYDKYSMRADRGFHYQQMRNTLQLNDGLDSTGTPLFSEIGELAGVSSTDWSWAPLFFDADNDGWKDLFISNGILRDMTNLDFVKYTSGYSSQANTTAPAENKKEMWELVKQMPSTKLNNYLFRNKHDLGFEDVTREWGITRKAINNGSAFADLDNDGNVDIVINNLNDQPTIYRNNGLHRSGHHYLKIKFSGQGKNTLGIGAKVFIKTAGSTQVQEQYTSRGFQSSVDPVMHIGLGSDSVIQSLRIVWPGGGEAIFKNVPADTLLIVRQSAATGIAAKDPAPGPALFSDVTPESGIAFTDHASTFVDFKVSPLLPYQLSKTGPSLSKGDANGDGREDLFIGGVSGKESVLFLQTADGHFKPAALQPWNVDKDHAVSDALFFDADGDSDLDLYLVSGGADYPLNSAHYQDRLFENDGHGNFRQLPDALPPETISGSCVRSADINHDGLPDLFVGGAVVPGSFPQAPASLILKNTSGHGRIQFTSDVSQTDSTLAHPGMVTDALWTDLNKDGWPDLVIAGRFMPVFVFENHQGRLQDASKSYGLAGTDGWWGRILADDLDQDGDTDLVIGNLGDNSQLKGSLTEPITVDYADFNSDGVLDPILCYFNNGISYPYFSRDELFEQLPALQKKFGRYADYSDARLTDLFSSEQLSAARSVKICVTGSMYFKNDHHHFSLSPLPQYAQISAVNGMVSRDIDGDGNKDIILAGNFFPFRVQLGPLDAGKGLVLRGDGAGHFAALPYNVTGLDIPGDVRNLITLQTGEHTLLVAAKNNGSVQVVRINK